MNTFKESTLVEQPVSNRIEGKDENYAVCPLGTFAGTIYKVLYRSNGRFVSSDTSDQLIADGRTIGRGRFVEAPGLSWKRCA